MRRAHRLLTAHVVFRHRRVIEFVPRAVDGHASPEKSGRVSWTRKRSTRRSGTVSCEFFQQELAKAKQALASDTTSVELHDGQVVLAGIVAGVCY